MKTNDQNFDLELFLIENLYDKSCQDFEETQDPKCFDLFKSKLTSKIIKKYPTIILSILFVFHIKLEEYDEAEEVLKHYEKLVPESEDSKLTLLSMKSMLNANTGKIDEAIENVKELFDKAKMAIDAVELIRLYLQKGEVEKADEIIEGIFSEKLEVYYDEEDAYLDTCHLLILKAGSEFLKGNKESAMMNVSVANNYLGMGVPVDFSRLVDLVKVIEQYCDPEMKKETMEAYLSDLEISKEEFDKCEMFQP